MQSNLSQEIEDLKECAPAVLSDVGCVREHNQDKCEFTITTAGELCAVCDGMGGRDGGDLAAQLAIDTLKRCLDADKVSMPPTALEKAVRSANAEVFRYRSETTLEAMGTTIVATLRRENILSIVHAGDSRAYFVEGRDIEQLTSDHTHVQEMINCGMITEQDAEDHPDAHVLSSCLGPREEFDFDLQTYEIIPNDEESTGCFIVLATDGLYTLVTANEIALSVSSLAPAACCKHLIELAKSRGGYDNIAIAILPLAGFLKPITLSSETIVDLDSYIQTSRVLPEENIKPYEIPFVSKKTNTQKKDKLKNYLLVFLSLLAFFLLIQNNLLPVPPIQNPLLAGDISTFNADTYYELGLSQLENSDYKQAQTAFRTVLRINPRYAKARYSLAKSYEAQQDFVNAIEQYQVFLSLSQDETAQELLPKIAEVRAKMRTLHIRAAKAQM
jgi:PPM family protein phosphatase